MSVVAIVGAGTLGGSLAHTIAARDRFEEVRLIDDAPGAAIGKALDIQQAAPIERFHTRLVACEDLAAASGADVVTLTGPAGTPETEWDDASGLSILEQLADNNRHGVFVCAGASHQRLVERGVVELGIPRQQLLGSAPEGLRAALAAIIALELRCAASEVSVTVLGAPPERTVVPWSQVTVGGFTLDQRLSPMRLARLREKVPRVWPPGPYTLASSAARVCESVVGGVPRSPSCFIVLEGELGSHGKSTAMMVELDQAGVSKVLEPSLSILERVQLETVVSS